MARAPVVLVVAGSDPSGGAGLQGDLTTLSVLGCYGAAVPTALTVQARSGVRRVWGLDPGGVERSIGLLLGQLPVAAVKVGMLWDGAIARAVARGLAGYRGPVVLDPVLRASRGQGLSRRDLVDALHSRLMPVVRVLTPNLDEVEALCGWRVRSLEQMVAAAQALGGLGPSSVLLKGGHYRGARPRLVGGEGDVPDVLVDREGTALLLAPHRSSRRKHGTGCALSTMIAAHLAIGRSPRQACLAARGGLDRALRRGHAIGTGTDAVAHHAFGALDY